MRVPVTVSKYSEGKQSEGKQSEQGTGSTLGMKREQLDGIFERYRMILIHSSYIVKRHTGKER